MRIIQSKVTKTNSKKNFQTEGRAPGAPVLDPPLVRVVELYIHVLNVISDCFMNLSPPSYLYFLK